MLLVSLLTTSVATRSYPWYLYYQIVMMAFVKVIVTHYDVRVLWVIEWHLEGQAKVVFEVLALVPEDTPKGKWVLLIL